MKKIVFTMLLLTVTLIAFGQTTQTKYFSNEWLEKEVAATKAKFSQTITQNGDTVTTEVKNLKKNTVTRRQTYKGDEPFGIWVYQMGDGTAELDYNFPLQYSQQKCGSSVLPIKETNDYFQDNAEWKYKAPVLASGDTKIYMFLGMNLYYPAKARENNIQGLVHTMLTITKEGNVENIVVTKGINIELDKEAVRVLRKLKFSKPPTINGQPQTLCVDMPVSFRLE